MGIGSCEGGTRGIFDLMYEGKKDFRLVVVDPRCSPEASKGEWVPIRPGSDLAFLMALVHVILYRNQEGLTIISLSGAPTRRT